MNSLLVSSSKRKKQTPLIYLVQRFSRMIRMNRSFGAAVRGGLTGVAFEPVVRLPSSISFWNRLPFPHTPALSKTQMLVAYRQPPGQSLWTSPIFRIPSWGLCQRHVLGMMGRRRSLQLPPLDRWQRMQHGQTPEDTQLSMTSLWRRSHVTSCRASTDEKTPENSSDRLQTMRQTLLPVATEHRHRQEVLLVRLYLLSRTSYYIVFDYSHR